MIFHISQEDTKLATCNTFKAKVDLRKNKQHHCQAKHAQVEEANQGQVDNYNQSSGSSTSKLILSQYMSSKQKCRPEHILTGHNKKRI